MTCPVYAWCFFCLHIATLPSLWLIHLQLHPFTPGIFAKKKKGLWSKLSHLFFQSLPDYWRARTAQNTVYLSSTSHPNSLPNFKHAQKAKFQDSFWVLKWESSLDFHLSLSHLLSSFTLFLAPFFPFCWVFTMLYFGGNIFSSGLLDWIILILNWFESSHSLGHLGWQRQVDLDHQNWWHYMR